MKMMSELIELSKRLAEIMEANSDTALIALIRVSGTVIARPENFTRTIYGGDGVFEFYELHTPVGVAQGWTLPVGTVLAVDNKFCEVVENKVLAVEHEDPVITVTDASLGIPEILNAKANTRFVVNDLDVRYTCGLRKLPGSMDYVPLSYYIISSTAENEDEPLVEVVYGKEHVTSDEGLVEKPWVTISVFGQPEATELPSKYQLIVDALMVNEANR